MNNWIVVVIVLGVWFALTKWLLPKLGIPT